jgi:site-specific DNA-methyltransferase (adenine-specific)
MDSNSVCFSSKSDHWQTPQPLFDQLDAEFHFHCDVAADETNSKCGQFLSDPLNTPWYPDTYFMNPPYSKWGEFIKKAHEESKRGSIIVCLIPSRTCTKAWHAYVMQAYEIRLIKKRVRFVSPDPTEKLNSAPFPSCVVVFNEGLVQLRKELAEKFKFVVDCPKLTTMEVNKS